MNRQVVINVSESFAILCTFWNISPEEIISFYLKHISMSDMISRLELDPERNSEYSDEKLKKINERLVDDPFALATYYIISSNSQQEKLSPMRLPKFSLFGKIG